MNLPKLSPIATPITFLFTASLTAGLASGVAHAADKAAVFEFELQHGDLVPGSPSKKEDEDKRRAMISEQLREHLAKSGFQVVDTQPFAEKAAAANLQACGNCADDFARELGADYAFTGVVYKVSELILSMSVLVHDARTSQPLTSATVDLWQHRRILAACHRLPLSKRPVLQAGETEEMTKMLASVADLDEAEIAISGGADIIDLKDPWAGALGAIATETIRQVVKAVAGRRATSAVLGDLPMEPDTIRARAEEVASTGVDYVKAGFFPSPNAVACAEALAAVAARTKLVAVLFADKKPDFGLLDVFAKHRFHSVMVDTADKTKGRLLDHLPPERIPAFVDRARALGLKVGLSGSLETPDIPRLLPLAPDFLGFRGALCDRSQRTASISADAVAHIRSLIPEERQADRSASVDYRLLAARGYSPGAGDPTLGTDKIFVRDFVLPVQIGAYSFEHGHTQKVRFDVTADVLRVTKNPEDMRHVFSYDVIMDGIRAIIARGHVELSETLAEQVAAHVLDDPRVVRVTVRVEKLELGPGGVGVEIERRRASEKPVQKPASQPEKPQLALPGGKKGLTR